MRASWFSSKTNRQSACSSRSTTRTSCSARTRACAKSLIGCWNSSNATTKVRFLIRIELNCEICENSRDTNALIRKAVLPHFWMFLGNAAADFLNSIVHVGRERVPQEPCSSQTSSNLPFLQPTIRYGDAGQPTTPRGRFLTPRSPASRI